MCGGWYQRTYDGTVSEKEFKGLLVENSEVIRRKKHRTFGVISQRSF
jgi:hypothetical protein